MKASEHFTIDELLRSDKATENGIVEQFTPPQLVIENLTTLAQKVLEPLRLKIGKPISITSGYRCERINKLVGGAKDSQHVKGEAADTHVDGMSVEDWYQFIKQSGIPFDQLIQEFDNWVHVSYNPFGAQRNECLRATNKNGVKYTPDKS